ncbi:homeobox domain protein [Oesophagostomum dentatum]|uniref:Homeobox domain protein n=1 Tax=Oesophagostomum dentatum TaxID=61180 RepID=A0A0B1TWT4_OESDE|nr:homeobox domain protein [Oesophagostomum dentatum]
MTATVTKNKEALLETSFTEDNKSIDIDRSEGSLATVVLEDNLHGTCPASSTDIAILEERFASQKYLTSSERTLLAEQLKMSDAQTSRV